MTVINTLDKLTKKMMVTLKDFRKTAYHHYGENPFSFIKFIYYSGIRINTFLVFENDLTKELPEHELDPNFIVTKPTLEELSRIRKGKVCRP